MTQTIKRLSCWRPRFDPWVGKIPWRRKWQPTPVLLPGKSHGWRSMVGYSPWGLKESDTTKSDFTSLPSELPGKPLGVKVKGVTPPSSLWFLDPHVLPCETLQRIKRIDLRCPGHPGGWCLILASGRLWAGASAVPSIGQSCSLRLAASGWCGIWRNWWILQSCGFSCVLFVVKQVTWSDMIAMWILASVSKSP